MTKKKTAAESIKQTKLLLETAVQEDYTKTGAIWGTVIGAVWGNILGGLGLPVGVAGGLAGGTAGALLDLTAGQDNYEEFMRIQEPIIKQLNEIVLKYDLRNSFTPYSNNLQGDRYFGITFHEEGVKFNGTAGSRSGPNFVHGPHLTFFTRMNDTIWSALKRNLPWSKEDIWYEAEYWYIDPDGDNGVVNKSKTSSDANAVIQFCDEFLSRRADIFKKPTDRTMIRPAW